MRPWFLLSLVVACSSAPAAVAPAPRPRTWATQLDADHPLVGKIWSVRESRFVTEPEMLAKLDGRVLLGEKHDNADHHRLQAEVLQALVKKRPVVAFEMLEQAQQPAIDAARKEAPRDAQHLATAVGWEKSGWPAFALYAPVFQTALDADLAIVGTGIPRRKPGAPAPALDTGAPLAPDDERSLTEELRESHCGKLPEEVLPKMIAMQRARDTAMAKALDAVPWGVLVAGTGHTRKDRGAGRDIPGAWSVAFAEVDKAKTDPASYAPRWNTTKLPFDYVWFTPRANDDDPCAGM